MARRSFIGQAAAVIAVIVAAMATAAAPASAGEGVTTAAFAREVARVLPEDPPYGCHKRLSEGSVHEPRRDPAAKPQPDELALPGQGWKLVWKQSDSPLIQNAVRDFQDYLAASMQVRVELEGRDSLAGWQGLSRCIVVGTLQQLAGCGGELKGPKDYEIVAGPQRITVCGFDERGAMFGLFNLEERMNLREGPFVPARLKAIRHSLYDVRLVHSWMGWMDFPDRILSHMAHDGFDGIFASVYANVNNDRTTAEAGDSYARFYYTIRNQDPARMHDLIKRAARFGIKVYVPVLHQYLGTPESEAALRKLMCDILKDFPEIQGYILLTEGFWYKKWGSGRGADKEYMRDWARNWCHAVGVVAEECHQVSPAIEVLPWEYNIDFRAENAEMKRYFIKQLPQDTIPLLTWENGKSFEIDGLKGHLIDYSLNQLGPAEVTQAQIEEARSRGMKVYSKVDTFASWEFGTSAYLPFPYQWHARYQALEKYGVNGTLESWSSGYNPNFMTELRAWSCWSDAPPLEDLLGAIAARQFGAQGRAQVLKAWEHFSQAVRLMPDTGPTMGTNNAIGNPLFFEQPPARNATFMHSWIDSNKHALLNPFWPFTVSYLIFLPDFTNRVNKAELYARSSSGIQAGKGVKVLPVFLKYLRQADRQMEEGLRLYRAAALGSPAAKRERAVREVVIAEQIQRMMQSECAILEFEDLRLKAAAEPDRQKAAAILEKMETIVREEIVRTELSLLAATRDSRLGFQYEQDYVYTPYSLREKLGVLRATLNEQLPAARRAAPFVPKAFGISSRLQPKP